jgi:hypothetical protein
MFCIILNAVGRITVPRVDRASSMIDTNSTSCTAFKATNVSDQKCLNSVSGLVSKAWY